MKIIMTFIISIMFAFSAIPAQAIEVNFALCDETYEEFPLEELLDITIEVFGHYPTIEELDVVINSAKEVINFTDEEIVEHYIGDAKGEDVFFMKFTTDICSPKYTAKKQAELFERLRYKLYQKEMEQRWEKNQQAFVDSYQLILE